MITQWKLRNFKSVRNETTIDLAPLTVFAGKNSSGKSTILQSILLVSQTLLHENDAQQIVLNGRYVQLGDFSDIKSINGEAGEIIIGWNIELTQEHGQDSHDSGGDVMTISCELAFDEGDVTLEIPSGTNAVHVLSSITLAVDKREVDDKVYRYVFHADRTSEESTGRKHMIASGTLGEALHRTLDYDVQLERMRVGTGSDAEPINISEYFYRSETVREQITDFSFNNRYSAYTEIKAYAREMLYRSEPVGCSWWHFMPLKVTVSAEIEVERIEAIRNGIFGNGGAPFDFIGDVPIIIPDPVKSVIKKIVSDISPEDYDAYEALIQRDLERTPHNEDPPEVILLDDLVNELIELLESDDLELDDFADMLSYGDFSATFGFRNIIMNKLNRSQEFQGILDSMIADIRRTGEIRRKIAQIEFNEDNRQLKSFFTSSVRYLGPLRIVPDPSYPVSSAISSSDVGVEGENTAAVFDAEKMSLITYIPSASFLASPARFVPVSGTLMDAVVDWLSYLGVAEDIESRDFSKYGHSLLVSTGNKGRARDLADVGVGVSQVLPILVSGLLAGADTTFIVEQPELHLHPKVQSRLADFFLSLTQLGKQCLVETHSEHIINRLRFRIAESSEDSRLLGDTKIYFVEKTAGVSSFLEVCINEYGVATEWPEGFFDETILESEKRIRAAAIKRNTNRRHN